MSYYYKNNEYEYDDYSNHSNNDEYEYDSYSNYAESDHCDLDPEPPPSELDLYLYEHDGDVNTTKYGNNTDREHETNVEWETEGSACDGIYGHGEPEYVPEGLEYEDGVLVRGEYEHNTREYEDMEKENEVYEPHEPKYDDEMHKLEELEHVSSE
jgi:hypothetical protein